MRRRLHQIFTKLAAERIGDGLGGFVVEATAALIIGFYLFYWLSAMKQLVRKIGPLLLAFLLGVAAKTLWDHRQGIREFLVNPFLYYQD